MSINLETLTIEKAHAGLSSGEFTVRELVDAHLAIIAEKNDELNAYVHLHTDIDEQVKKAQDMYDAGTATQLTGIPCALKANLMRKGQVTHASSKILEHYKATYTATVVKKLEQEGVVFLGSTNMDEFAMGTSTENSAFGVTKNPHDPSRVPGGSSGGSAVAVAAHMALFSLGTDTGGSIRQPAALCGVTGLKTTYGGVSRYGAIAMASSLDQIGPFTKNARDAEIVWNILKGNDPHDMTTLQDDTWKDSSLKETYSIAIPEDFLKDVEGPTKELFERSITKLKEAGHTITKVSIPTLAYSLPAYYVLVPAEVSSNLARYDGIRYGSQVDGKNLIDTYVQTKSQGLGAEAKRRIILGTYVLSAGYADDYYAQALTFREKIKQELKTVFETYDFIATPTTLGPAFRLGEKSDDPLALYLEDIFTVTANIASLPAVSVPAGSIEIDQKHLPVGIQFMGRHAGDAQVLDVAQKFESL